MPNYRLWASGPGPSYVEIKRINNTMSNEHDTRNAMLLNEEQKKAYHEAYYIIVLEDDPDKAQSCLMPHFERAEIQRYG
jgi:hypothetical protein